MRDASLRNVATPPMEVIDGRRTPDALRDHAYTLWAWQYGRSAAAVAHALDLAPRTVQHWAQVDRWHERYTHERSETAPAAYRAVVDGNLKNAAVYCSAYFEAVARGERAPTKEMTQACQIVLDRAGYAPIHLRMDLEPQRASIATAPTSPPSDADAQALRDFLTRRVTEGND